jgi:C-terminal processing protease CtpA/Prc
MLVTPGISKSEISSDLIVQFQDGKLLLRAQGAALWEILDALDHKCMVKISGLEHREAEPVTFLSRNESVEDVLKRFLHHLGEINYAFEFADENLRRVSVFPKSTTSVYSPKTVPEDDVGGKEFIDAVKIMEIVKGSQAESLALRKGDIIIEYDDLRITKGPQELVEEVQKKSNKESVTMVVVHNGRRVKLALKGGLIGVRVDLAKIPKE